MSPEKKKQGFATFSPEEHKKLSSKGGQKRGVKKGFATLAPDGTSHASRASKARWSKVKEARNVKPSPETRE